MKKKPGRRGPSTPFGAKDPPNESFSLTNRAKRIIARAAVRAKTSKSNVIELLARKHGDTVQASDFT